MARILVVRISSLGDVAMLVPAICSVAAKYPQDRFTVLTRTAYAPLFQNLGFNINVMPFNPKKHGGLLGFFRVLKKVMNKNFTHIADVHDVLRSKGLRGALRLFGRKVAYIDKGRAEKQHFVNSKIVNAPLKTSTQRYMEVFADLGFPAELSYTNFFTFTTRNFYLLRSVVGEEEKTGKWIGIAPFAKHEEKTYPLEKMEKIVDELSSDPDNKILLFGARRDSEVIDAWCEKYPNTMSVVGKFSLATEMLLISYLDVMVSMDSANMHLASLAEIPVVSVWGATHPHMGFYDLNQSFDNAVFEEIDCRPCSVYGNIECERSEHMACMNRLSEKKIIDKVKSILNEKKG